MSRVGLLGAERQAAVSFAESWPEKRFTFVTEQAVCDGWDLENVEIVWGSVGQEIEGMSDRQIKVIPLCGEWLAATGGQPDNGIGSFGLYDVLGYLSGEFDEYVLGVTREPPPDVEWVLKGDLRHRPDMAISGRPAEAMLYLDDPYGCGSLFQRKVETSTCYLVTGYREERDSVDLSVLKVHQEAFYREDFLLAAETVRDDELVELSVAMLDAIDQRGYFSMNWLGAAEGKLLTSLRPFPRAVFPVFAECGLNLVDRKSSGVNVVPAGIKLIGSANYSSYKEMGR
ncbi:MAG: hypothetical protein AAF591_05430 [Verrucomicrobiota bacterium]